MLSLLQYNQFKQGADPAKFITSTCLYPKKVFISDVLGKSQVLYVPCGCCVRCADASREQWVSRMSLHSLCYKHCYFVTLTYGSYDLYKYEQHPFKKFWLETCPRKSTNNSRKSYVYMPTLLRQEHLTAFLKRLRKRLGFPITYCAAGEYGEKYLRPHFHLIIWSDEIITKEDICLSWSYDCYKKSETNIVRNTGNVSRYNVFRFLIGRVDFHDLVANGTLDFDALQNQHNIKSRHVFSYVAKYVAKHTAVNPRLYKHILSAYNHFDYVEPFLERDDKNAAIQSVLNETSRANTFGYVRNLKNTIISDYVDEDGTLCITLKHNQKTYEKVTKNQFVQIFAPFFVSSRGTAIGRPYFDKNIERFHAKCYDLPKFHNKTLVFPRYFLRLLQNEKYPVYFSKQSLLCRSYSQDFVPFVRDYYLQLLQDRNIYHLPLNIVLPPRKNTHKFTKEDFAQPTFICLDGYITYVYSPTTDSFYGYKYNRSEKSYKLYEVCDRVSFCSYIVEKCNARITDVRNFEDENKILNEFHQELLSFSAREEVVSSFVSRREEKSKLHNIQHNQFSTL